MRSNKSRLWAQLLQASAASVLLPCDAHEAQRHDAWCTAVHKSWKLSRILKTSILILYAQVESWTHPTNLFAQHVAVLTYIEGTARSWQCAVVRQVPPSILDENKSCWTQFDPRDTAFSPCYAVGFIAAAPVTIIIAGSLHEEALLSETCLEFLDFSKQSAFFLQASPKASCSSLFNTLKE